MPASPMADLGSAPGSWQTWVPASPMADLGSALGSGFDPARVDTQRGHFFVFLRFIKAWYYGSFFP